MDNDRYTDYVNYVQVTIALRYSLYLYHYFVGQQNILSNL